MNLKIYLLSGLLFTASASAYAQEEAKVVTLANDAGAVTWSQFVNAINNPSSIQGSADDTALKAAQAAYASNVAKQEEADNAYTVAAKAFSDAEAQLKKWQDDRQSLVSDQGNVSADLITEQGKTAKEPFEWLKTAYSNALTFYTDFEAGNTSSNAKIYYKEITGGGFGGGSTTLIVSFNESSANEGYSGATPLEFYNKYIGAGTQAIKSLKVYFGKNNEGAFNYTTTTDGILSVTAYTGGKDYLVQQALGAIEPLLNNENYTQYKNQAERDKLTNQLADLKDKINALSANIDGYTKPKEGAELSEQDRLRNASELAKDAKDKADATVATSEVAVKDAKDAYDKAVADSKDAALANYKEVVLTADVTATTTINKFDGTIYGGRHVITLSGIDQLFGTFDGILANLAVNGDVFRASTTKASYTNVAYWNGSTGAFRDDDHNRTAYDNLGQLGFKVRDLFGVDFATNKLAPNSETSKVYNLTVYENPRTTYNKYVQVKGDAFVGADNNNFTIPTNTFAKSETRDLTGFKNIFYDDNTCEEAVITDRETFYCPVDLQVTNLEYKRKFTTGMNAVCLPFDLTYDTNSQIEALCAFDKETPEKFYFKKTAEDIPANTPVLLVAKEGGFELSELSNVFLHQTPAEQMVMDEGDEEDPSKGYGLLKKATRDQFKGGASESYKVYGLKNNGMFGAASATALFPAFRMVLYSALAQESGQMSAPRRIGILDEKGVEITDAITTGIDDVYNDGTELDITVAAGEIVISSAKDLGEVTVYSVDGKVAAVADVAAGTTTVNVQNGLYIVLGKKVMVK